MAEILLCPTPLSWEVASRFMSGEEGYGLGQRYLGFDPAPGTILQRIAGHVYVDLDRESIVSALTKKVRSNRMFKRVAPNTFSLLDSGSETNN